MSEELSNAIQTSKTITDRRFLGFKDEARGIEKLKPIHGWIARNITKTMDGVCDPQLTVVGYGTAFEESISSTILDGAELAFPTIYLPSKTVNVSVARKRRSTTPTGRVGKSFEYEPVAGVLSKCVFYNYAQNAPNYLQDLMAETILLRKKGYPVGVVFFLNNRPEYRDKHGNVKRVESISKEDLSRYLELAAEDTNTCFWKPNAMLFKVFSVEGDGKITFPSATELGFDPQKDQHLISIYNRVSDIPTFFQDFVGTIPTQLAFAA